MTAGRRLRRTWIVAVAVLVSVTLVLGGCGGESGTAPAGSDTAKPADVGKAPGSGTPDVHPPKSADADK